MFILVCYDVSNDKLRDRVARTLEGFGKRVQYSVFECHLTAALFRKLRRALATVFDAAGPDDSVRFYFLCASCEPKAEVLGRGEITEDPSYFIA